jgi:integrase
MATIKSIDQDNTSQSDLLTEAIQSVINTATTRANGKGGFGLSKNRIASYASFKKIIEAYQLYTRNIYKVKNVNIDFTNKLLNYLLIEKDYSKSYALKKIGDLKTVCLSAELQGLETDSELKTIKSFKEKKQNITYLVPSELEKIKNLSIDDSDLQNARKWLLIGCNIGQRAGDLLNLNKNSFTIKNGLEVIELTQEKTGKHITIPNQTAIKKIVKDGFPEKVSIQKLNTQIKEICKLSQINTVISGVLYSENSKRRTEGNYEKYKLITSHVCRRTFAMNNYGKIPTHLLKKITGHTTEAILRTYIGKNPLKDEQQTYRLF